MERRIEHDDLRHSLAENAHAGANALHVRAVVQRRERDQALNALDDLVVDQHRLAEQRAALDDAVADCGNLAEILDDADLAVEQRILDLLERFGVVLHADLDLLLAAVRGLVTENAHLKADLLAVALGEHLLVVHVDQLILERGAAGVDNQNFHYVFPLWS